MNYFHSLIFFVVSAGGFVSVTAGVFNSGVSAGESWHRHSLPVLTHSSSRNPGVYLLWKKPQNAGPGCSKGWKLYPSRESCPLKKPSPTSFILCKFCSRKPLPFCLTPRIENSGRNRKVSQHYLQRLPFLRMFKHHYRTETHEHNDRI